MDDFTENFSKPETEKKSPFKTIAFYFLIILILALSIISSYGIIFSSHTSPENSSLIIAGLLQEKIDIRKGKEIIEKGHHSQKLIQPFAGIDFTIKREELTLDPDQNYRIFTEKLGKYLFTLSEKEIKDKFSDTPLNNVLNDLKEPLRRYKNSNNMIHFFGTVALFILIIVLTFFVWKNVSKKKGYYFLGITGLSAVVPAVIWLHFPKFIWNFFISEKWFIGGSDSKKLFIENHITTLNTNTLFEYYTVAFGIFGLISIISWIIRVFKKEKTTLVSSLLLWGVIIALSGRYFYLWVSGPDIKVASRQALEDINPKIKKSNSISVIYNNEPMKKLEVSYYTVIETGLGLVTELGKDYTDKNGAFFPRLLPQKGLICSETVDEKSKDLLKGCIAVIKGIPQNDKLVLNNENTIKLKWPDDIDKSDEFYSIKIKSYKKSQEEGFSLTKMAQNTSKRKAEEISAMFARNDLEESENYKKAIDLLKLEIDKAVETQIKAKGWKWSGLKEYPQGKNLFITFEKDLNNKFDSILTKYLKEQIKKYDLKIDYNSGQIWSKFIVSLIDIEKIAADIIKKRTKELNILSKEIIEKVESYITKYPEMDPNQIIIDLIDNKPIMPVFTIPEKEDDSTDSVIIEKPEVKIEKTEPENKIENKIENNEKEDNPTDFKIE